jgi:serine/threonine-protein kinase
LVGGRFLVEGLEREDSLFSTLRARDQKTKRPIAIHVLSANLAGDKPSFDMVRGEIKAAARFKHRSLVGTFGVGTHGGNAHFVACEWVPGRPLSEFLQERRELGEPLSVRGVYNVIAHVCKALAHVHENSCHGALRPQVVWITHSGRVKVGDLGLSLAMASSGKWALLPAEEQAYLAPEVKAGAVPDARSDIFGVGALMYVMLTGRSPTEEFVTPSQAHTDATPELDAVLLRCLSSEPSERYASAGDVIEALLPIAARSPEPQAEAEFGVDLEIDIDIATSIAPRPASGPIVFESETPAPPTAPPGPPLASRASSAGNGAARPFNPLASASFGGVSPPGGAPAAGAQRASAPKVEAPAVATPGVELGALMEQLTANDAPRWMAVKDGLDHGPFTARELIKLVVEGQIQDKHVLLNMDSNERKALGEYEQFAEFVQQYKLRRATPKGSG